MDRLTLTIDGPVATITNNNPAKHNAFDDEMDAALFDHLDRLRREPAVRAVVWRGEGPSWSSGRDVGSIGNNRTDLTHHQLMTRGIRGIQRLWDLDPVFIVACKGWVMGGSFQRALLCDIRIAAEGTRFRLPELSHGVIPDTGGAAVLYEMCGHGVVSDMVLTGRTMSAAEALHHGVVSRLVPEDQLDATAFEIAARIASAPAAATKMARTVIRHLSIPALRASMEDELVFQTFVTQSQDFEAFRRARADGTTPTYIGS